MGPTRAVLWDLGHTLVDWDPRRLYRQLLDDDHAVEDFLGGVCTMAWHTRHDAGVTMADNRAALLESHPGKAALITAWDTRWPEMFNGWITGMEAIVAALEAAATPQYALTNLPAEKWPHILQTYPAIARFDAHVVSGEEKLVKPDPRIYALTAQRIDHDPAETVFFDDRQDNVDAARAFGFDAVRFENAAQVRTALTQRGLVV
jgi:FMN phosphatase YigB (HAD superfamily)